MALSPRALLLLGAVATTAGLVAAAATPVIGTPGAESAGFRQFVGGIFVLVGWAALAWGIHRFGREKA